MMFGASAMIGFGQGFQPDAASTTAPGFIQRVKAGLQFCGEVLHMFFAIGALLFLFIRKSAALFRRSPRSSLAVILRRRFQEAVTFCCSS